MFPSQLRATAEQPGDPADQPSASPSHLLRRRILRGGLGHGLGLRSRQRGVELHERGAVLLRPLRRLHEEC